MSAVEHVFLDTNVLVYAHDRSEPVRGPQAQQLLTAVTAAGRPFISVQVLSEFYWTVTRKISLPLTHAEATAEIARLQTVCHVAVLSSDVVEKALEIVGTHTMALWDAQILAAAKLHGAKFLVSEDFQHRQALEGVTFLNPFAADFTLGEILAP